MTDMTKLRLRTHKNFLYSIWFLLFPVVFLLSVSLGSVRIPILDSLKIILNLSLHVGDISAIPDSFINIIANIRIPRVMLCILVGAALSISGAAMQGLLRNPLADSNTLGISSFSALGSVIAIWLGIRTPFLQSFGTAFLSILFAFGSLLLLLSLSARIDRSMSSNTIILTGVILSMLASSIISLLVTFSGEKLKSIIFWTMGSFSGLGWEQVFLVLPFMIIGIAGLLRYFRELNAFALGEENAGYIGVNTRRVKISILIFVSILVGVSVSVSGTIGFVGLVIPHITRMLFRPDHKVLLPMSLIIGATFMMLTDLVSRTILSPIELPIGILTSLIGCILFIHVFYSQRKNQRTDRC